MNLTLTDDNGYVIREWYIPEQPKPEGVNRTEVVNTIDMNPIFPAHESEGDYNIMIKEMADEAGRRG